MEPTNYTPIDYPTWKFSGKGANLVDLLTPREDQIWLKALEFQDKRDDMGHAEIVTYFAVKLTDFLS